MWEEGAGRKVALSLLRVTASRLDMPPAVSGRVGPEGEKKHVRSSCRLPVYAGERLCRPRPVGAAGGRLAGAPTTEALVEALAGTSTA